MRTCTTIDYRQQDDMIIVDLYWGDRYKAQKLLDAGWEWTDDGKLKREYSKKEVDYLVAVLPNAYFARPILNKGGNDE